MPREHYFVIQYVGIIVIDLIIDACAYIALHDTQYTLVHDRHRALVERIVNSNIAWCILYSAW